MAYSGGNGGVNSFALVDRYGLSLGRSVGKCAAVRIKGEVKGGSCGGLIKSVISINIIVVLDSGDVNAVLCGSGGKVDS